MKKFSELDGKEQSEMLDEWAVKIDQIDDELWQDEDFVLGLIRSHYRRGHKLLNRDILEDIFKNMPTKYMTKEFILKLNDSKYYIDRTDIRRIRDFVPQEYRGDKKFLVQLLEKYDNYHVFSFSSPKIQEDREFYDELKQKYEVISKRQAIEDRENRASDIIEEWYKRGECWDFNDYKFKFSDVENCREELIRMAPQEMIKIAFRIGVIQLSELTPAHKNNEEIIRIAIKQDFENINEASDRIKESKEFRQYVEMADAIKQYRENDNMKLKDLKSEYFTNPLLYNKVVQIVKDKMQAKFMEVTQGLNPDEELNEELQAKFEKQLSKVQSELERRKKFAMFKVGIKDKVDKLLHRDEASKAMKQMSKFEV